MYTLDRTIGKGHSHEANTYQSAYWKTKSAEERLAAAMYLNSVAYNFDINHPPRIDRTVFRTRKHKII
jgi:hypothetical protein